MVQWRMPQEGDPFYDGIVQVAKYLVLASRECEKTWEENAPDKLIRRAKDIWFDLANLKAELGSMLTGVYDKALKEAEKEKPCQSGREAHSNSDRVSTKEVNDHDKGEQSVPTSSK